MIHCFKRCSVCEAYMFFVGAQAWETPSIVLYTSNLLFACSLDGSITHIESTSLCCLITCKQGEGGELGLHVFTHGLHLWWFAHPGKLAVAICGNLLISGCAHVSLATMLDQLRVLSRFVSILMSFAFKMLPSNYIAYMHQAARRQQTSGAAIAEIPPTLNSRILNSTFLEVEHIADICGRIAFNKATAKALRVTAPALQAFPSDLKGSWLPPLSPQHVGSRGFEGTVLLISWAGHQLGPGPAPCQGNFDGFIKIGLNQILEGRGSQQIHDFHMFLRTPDPGIRPDPSKSQFWVRNLLQLGTIIPANPKGCM